MRSAKTRLFSKSGVKCNALHKSYLLAQTGQLSSLRERRRCDWVLLAMLAALPQL